MLLSIAHSTQQKFSEMVKNIMQDIRLEANVDAIQPVEGDDLQGVVSTNIDDELANRIKRVDQ